MIMILPLSLDSAMRGGPCWLASHPRTPGAVTILSLERYEFNYYVVYVCRSWRRVKISVRGWSYRVGPIDRCPRFCPRVSVGPLTHPRERSVPSAGLWHDRKRPGPFRRAARPAARPDPARLPRLAPRSAAGE